MEQQQSIKHLAPEPLQGVQELFACEASPGNEGHRRKNPSVATADLVNAET